jgi:hypothetical protein
MATNMDKGLYQAPQGLQEESAVEIEIEDPKSIGIQTPDGSVVIDFGDQEDAKDDDFSANLAEFVPDNELSGLVTELVDAKVRAGGDILIYGKPSNINQKTIAGGSIKEAN